MQGDLIIFPYYAIISCGNGKRNNVRIIDSLL